jgi:hypothetical protein
VPTALCASNVPSSVMRSLRRLVSRVLPDALNPGACADPLSRTKSGTNVDLPQSTARLAWATTRPSDCTSTPSDGVLTCARTYALPP